VEFGGKALKIAAADGRVQRSDAETSRIRRLQYKEKQVELALYIAVLIISVVLIVLVVLQARSPGMANRDTSSIYRTRRGLEKTMHQATIALGVIFLVLALIASLPIFT
jgi:preprotein translocase subunit SecG